MDLEYKEYIDFSKQLIEAEHILGNIMTLKSFGKFFMDKSKKWEPKYYPGFTLITPTYPEDLDNQEVYSKIISYTQQLFKKTNLHKVLEAPKTAYHLTLARLISDEDYINKIGSAGELVFLRQFSSFFRELSPILAIQMRLTGFSVLTDGVIVAIITAFDEEEYNKLVLFRKQIYSNPNLQALGIEQKQSFMGHINLGYIESDLCESEKRLLYDTIIKINMRLYLENLHFYVLQGEFRKFENDLSFNRHENWPVFKFS